ncbi:MAG: AMP-binding protein [bacterium]
MNLMELFVAQVAIRPQQEALYVGLGHRGQSLRFAALDLLSQRVARLFHEEGLVTGDGVLVLLPLSLELYATLLAIFRLGLVAIVIDPGANRATIAQCVERYPIKGFVGTAKAHLWRQLHPSLRAIPHGWNPRNWVAGLQAEPYAELLDVSDDHPALITFTSGSTGVPKAAVRSHGFLVAQQRVLASSLDLQAETVDLTTLPIFGLANLAAGVTCVLAPYRRGGPGSCDVAGTADLLQYYRPARITGSPALLEVLMDHARDRKESLAFLRRVDVGGGPVFPLTIARLHQAAPEARINVIYGSTEAEPMTHIAHGDITEDDIEAMREGAGLLVGSPVPEVTLRIIPDSWGTPLGPFTGAQFDALVLPSKQIGEIVVSGPHVLGGYLDGVGDAENKFKVDGVPWHRTGDAGVIDAMGRLWLQGRCSAKIVDDLGTIYPLGAEAAAMSHPAVRRAALIGRRSKRYLIVELHRGHSTAELSRISQQIGNPAHIEMGYTVRRMPMDRRHGAKIDYPALRKLLRWFR